MRKIHIKNLNFRIKGIIGEIAKEHDKTLQTLNTRDNEAICRFRELAGSNVKPNLNIKVRDYCDTLINRTKELLGEPSVLFKVQKLNTL